MPSANPKRRISKHSVVEVDEVELRLDRDPVDVADDDAFMHHKFQDGSRLIGYVINDPSPCHPLNDSDGDGKIYRFDRDSSKSERTAGLRELGRDEYGELDPENLTPNPFAVLIDKYEHSGVAWSVAGHGQQCRWDTSRGAGVWVPDTDLVDHIKITAAKLQLPDVSYLYQPQSSGETGRGYFEVILPDGRSVGIGPSVDLLVGVRSAAIALRVKLDEDKLKVDMRKEAENLASNACRLYTAYCNGDTYGIVFQRYTAEGATIESFADDEATYGFFGRDDAERELKEIFEHKVSSVLV